jgi:hypothetical protein
VSARKTHQWTKHDVRAFLTKRKGEEVTLSATESFLRRYGVVTGQVEVTNSKNAMLRVNVYAPAQIREAVKNMPGQGGPGKSRPARKKSG